MVVEEEIYRYNTDTDTEWTCRLNCIFVVVTCFFCCVMKSEEKKNYILLEVGTKVQRNVQVIGKK